MPLTNAELRELPRVPIDDTYTRYIKNMAQITISLKAPQAWLGYTRTTQMFDKPDTRLPPGPILAYEEIIRKHYPEIKIISVTDDTDCKRYTFSWE
jgi:hypothetical protein